MRFLITALTLGSLAFSHLTYANDEAKVRSFYTDILSATSAPDLEDRIAQLISPDWQNTPAPRGKAPTHRENFTGGMRYLSKAIPDLKWEIKEILNDRRFLGQIAFENNTVEPDLMSDILTQLKNLDNV